MRGAHCPLFAGGPVAARAGLAAEARGGVVRGGVAGVGQGPRDDQPTRRRPIGWAQ